MPIKPGRYYSRIVGNRHRLAGSIVLPVLEIGMPLLLDPEPDNEFDKYAVKVNVDMIGSEFVNDPNADGPIICLGYIPRSGTRTDTTGFGNRSVLQILEGGPNWTAHLTFSPQGDPLVCIDVKPITPLAEDGKIIYSKDEWLTSWYKGKISPN